jgi:hypothetical protein
MKAVEKLCEEVLELDKAASPGPWDNRCSSSLDNMDRPRHLWCEYGWVGETHGRTDDNVPNAQLISNYRTSAVKLARICQLQAEALKAIEDNPTRSSFREAGDNENNWTRWAKSRSLEALARAEQIAGNGL